MDVTTTPGDRVDRKALCVVVPLFNEAAVIEQFCDGLTAVLRSMEDRYAWEVLLVLDPSTDGTDRILRRIIEERDGFGAIFMVRRAGHQMSLVAGMDHCVADVCITMDGDLQHPPELIPEMLSLYEGGAEVVQTVRVITEGQGRMQKGLSSGFYRMVNRLSDVEMIEAGPTSGCFLGRSWTSSSKRSESGTSFSAGWCRGSASPPRPSHSRHLSGPLGRASTPFGRVRGLRSRGWFLSARRRSG